MQKRFIVKPVKIVWRHSMMAGNPVVKSFQKFGVYDSNWQNDPYCWCPNPGGQFLALWHARKYHIVVDNEELAKKIAEKLETLYRNVPNAKQIAFDGISSCMTDVDSITVKKVEYC